MRSLTYPAFVDEEDRTPFLEGFFLVAGQRTRRPEDDIARIMTPFERVRRGNQHVSPSQISIRFSQRYPSICSGSQYLETRI